MRIPCIQLTFHAENTCFHENADLIRQECFTFCPKIVVLPERCNGAKLFLRFLRDIENITITFLKLVQLVHDKFHRVFRENRRITILRGLIAGQQCLVFYINGHVFQNISQHKGTLHYIRLVLMAFVSFGNQHCPFSINIRLFIQHLFTECLHPFRQCTKMFRVFHSNPSFR